jgi:hypothetical protein
MVTCVRTRTGEQLHLTPITGVYQMRPSFAHIDAKEEAKKKKLANPEESGDAAKQVKKEEASEEASKIQVSVLHLLLLLSLSLSRHCDTHRGLLCRTRRSGTGGKRRPSRPR